VPGDQSGDWPLSGSMAYGLLGALAVHRAGAEVPVPPGQQRALLAALLLRAGRTVSVDELAETVWGAAAPSAVRMSVQNVVMRLRRTLGADAAAIVTEPDGYRITIGPDQLDVTRFEAALAGGRSAARLGDWAEASRLLAGGLALWRGEALSGVASELLTGRHGPRLAELRQQATEARIDADLHLGRHAEVIVELRGLAAAEPLRERLHALLMTALYRDGQQAAALAVYQAARTVLVDELGTEPGPELRRRHEQVLAGDPGLAAAPTTGPPTAALAGTGLAGAGLAGAGLADAGLADAGLADAGLADAGLTDSGLTDSGVAGPEVADGGPESGGEPAEAGVRYALPPDTDAFTGRGAELERIAAAVTGAGRGGGVVAIRAINGMPGVGKTALAVHAAHRLREQFPDRQLFLNLHGHTPGQEPVEPGAALARLLVAAGADPRALPDDTESRAALWRDRLAGQRALLVLDNAASSAQVVPLLPGGDSCLVLVTSRRHLADLPGAVVPVLLEVLPQQQARQMFLRLAPQAADAPAGEVTRLVELAGHLPLAISLLARVHARHPAWTLADLAAETRARLPALTAERDSVSAALDVSYQHLDAAAQRFFRHLGLHPGTSVDPHAAAALTGAPLADATRLLDALHGEGLLTETGYRRYGMHDLIRRYAADRGAADPAPDRAAAAGRLADYYEHVSGRAEGLLGWRRPAAVAAPPAAMPDLPDADRALAWLRAERASLTACLEQARRDGDRRRVVALTGNLSGLLRQDGPWAEALAWHQAAAAAARAAGDRAGEAGAVCELGYIQRLAGQYAAAAQTSRRALGLFRDLGDRAGEAIARHNLGAVAGMEGDYDESDRLAGEALVMFRELGNRPGEASALFYLGAGRMVRGDLPAAVVLLEQAVILSRDIGDRVGQAKSLTNLAEIRRTQGDYPGAIVLLEQALSLSRSAGAEFAVARVLASLGDTRLAAGDYRGAGAALAEAVRLARASGSLASQSSALAMLGKVRRLAGDYPAAAGALAEALRIAEDMGIRLCQADALIEIAALQGQTGEPGAAAQAVARAAGLYRDLGDRGKLASALNQDGLLHLSRGDPEGAADCYGEALALARQVDDPLAEGVALAGLARCARAAGNLSTAEAGLYQAWDALARIGAPGAAGIAAELADLAVNGEAARQAGQPGR
jgi:DNA-binding SARP family transcriptional activator/tetratricopeptide (TPR) repeat protein